MKRVIYFLVCGAMILGTQQVKAQAIDDNRMERDIAVAENVLSTLIKQEFSKRNFFPMEVRGTYRQGYGVTFTIPTEMLLPMVWGANDDFVVLDGTPGAYSYSFSFSDKEDESFEEEMERDLERKNEELKSTGKAMKRSEEELRRAEEDMKRAEQEMNRTHNRVMVTGMKRTQNLDSLRTVYTDKIIVAAKNYITDYGDMISQLGPNERIIITNKSDNQRWYFNQNEKRSVLSVEALKSDVLQLRQGKINRDQLIAKIKVTNTETSGKMEPDMELLTSIFNRLYRSDLSNTFFIEGGAYYERMSDYGAILYMQVYSSNQIDNGLYNMPTVNLRGVDQAARDKKVKELYPQFESELKENMLEYGRTIKSLKDNEQLIINVKLTKCKDCGIPSDVELSVKSSVLKDYGMGKLDKNSALNKIAVKKGAIQ